MKKRFLALCIALLMTVQLLPLTAFAANTGEPTADEAIVTEAVDASIPADTTAPADEGEAIADPDWQQGASASWHNPMFPDGPKRSEKYFSIAGDPIQGDLSPNNFMYNYSMVTDELADAMAERKETIYLYYQTNHILTEDELTLMLYDATAGKNGDAGYSYSTRGDYLLFSILDYAAGTQVFELNGTYYHVIVFGIAYMTTLEQDQALADRYSEIRHDILLSDSSNYNEYERIKAIYDYVCANVELQTVVNTEDITPYTAYGALTTGKALPQGYAMLFYYLCKNFGVDARIVMGAVEDVPYIWNMVCIRGTWYYTDITGDAYEGGYNYFLKGDLDFPQEYTPDILYYNDDFLAKHPLADYAFDPEHAFGGTVDGISWSYSDITEILHFSGSGPIPDDNHPWTSYEYPYTYTIVVEEGITHIGKSAFESIHTPASISLPDSLVSIGDRGFYNIQYLSEITLPKNLTSIGEKAFAGTRITQITIPAKVSSIDKTAFRNSYLMLLKVDPANPDFSADGALLYNKDKTTVLMAVPARPDGFDIAESVTSIADEAFLNCQWLTGVALHEGITHIGKNAFKGSSLAYLTLPSTLTTIGEEALAGTYLASLSIPASVTTFALNAFQNSSVFNLYYGGTSGQWDNIAIADGNDVLTSVTRNNEQQAVNGGSWFLDLTTGAFTCETSPRDPGYNKAHAYPWYPWRAIITDVQYNGTLFDWLKNRLDEYFTDSPNAVIHYQSVPTSGTWGDGNPWSFDVETATLTIGGSGNLSDAKGEWSQWREVVETIVISGEVNPDYSFNNYYRLNRVIFSEGITTIGSRTAVFDDTYGVETKPFIYLPASLTSLDARSFVKDSITNGDEIYAYIFFAGTEDQWQQLMVGCTNHKLVQSDVFFNNTCIHDLIITEGKEATCTETGLTVGLSCSICKQTLKAQTEIDKQPHFFSPFNYCSNCRKEYSYPSSGTCGDGMTWTINRDGTLTISGSGTMDDYSPSTPAPWSVLKDQISTVEFSKETTGVGDYAFYDYNNLTTIKGMNLTDIGSHTFAECDKLMEIDIKNIRSIGDSAFENSRLVMLNLPAKIESIGDNAFAGTLLTIAKYKGNEDAWAKVKVGKGNELLLRALIYADPMEDVTNNFTDVAEADYFFTPVMWAVAYNITTGTSPTTFAPDAECTRGQVVTFLWRAMGSPEPGSSNNPFTDVSEGDYFYKAVLWAKEKGITGGTSDTTFSPDQPCTRAQVATFLWRTMNKPTPASSDNPFTDVPAGQYYTDAVLWAVEKGVTTGVGNGMFAPENSCTRGQIVTFLYRALSEK